MSSLYGYLDEQVMWVSWVCRERAGCCSAANSTSTLSALQRVVGAGRVVMVTLLCVVSIAQSSLDSNFTILDFDQT